MIGYVYFQNSNVICGKLDNITSVKENQIVSGRDIITFGDGQDYIILESDTINKNIGDIIDLTNIVDARDYFLKGKDYWYQEQIKKHDNIIGNLKSMNDIYNSTLDYLMFNVLPNLVTTESSSSS
jgi:hypothetical protein